jgi:hypothetical protein
MFKIDNKGGWGSVIVAARDLLPGTEIFNDKAIVEFHDSFANMTASDALSAYNTFKASASVEEQSQLFMLPVHKSFLGRPVVKKLLEELTIMPGLRSDYIEQCILFVCILRQKSFELTHSSPPGRSLVFGTASLLYPSCSPNCYAAIDAEGRCICRSISFVRSGEMLTALFDDNLNSFGTSFRRNILLTEKDFTCHCPRCDALGDDARQFPCFNQQCCGTHWVCQPRQLDVPPGKHYEDVEYVQPHLLPCSACQSTPPLEYQAAMFELEERAKNKLTQMMGRASTFTAATFQETRLLPVQHYLGLTLAGYELGWFLDQPREEARLSQLASDMDALFASNIRYCQDRLYPIPLLVVRAYYKLGEYGRALALARRLLRLHRIVEGRDASAEHLEHQVSVSLALVRAGGHGPTATPSGCCVFCEESPERAAMKRSRCGACKKVVYCGTACQKAHWKVHKTECKH